MDIVARSNRALQANPPNATSHITTHGSNWLWAVTALYAISLLSFTGLAHAARHGERIFHYLLILASFTGTITYFAMASDLGATPVLTELNNGHREGTTRQIWYARYINWFISWACLDIAVLLLSGVSWATIVYSVGLSWVWVCSWQAGALVVSSYKWGFYTFGVFAYFMLALQLGLVGLIHAKRLGSNKHYSFTAFFLLFVWLLYPIAWGLDEGGSKISVTSGFIFYGILDVITVPVLGFVFLILARSWDYGALGLQFTQYGRTGRRDEGVFPEKALPGGPATAGGVTAPPEV